MSDNTVLQQSPSLHMHCGILRLPGMLPSPQGGAAPVALQSREHSRSPQSSLHAIPASSLAAAAMQLPQPTLQEQLPQAGAALPPAGALSGALGSMAGGGAFGSLLNLAGDPALLAQSAAAEQLHARSSEGAAAAPMDWRAEHSPASEAAAAAAAAAAQPAAEPAHSEPAPAPSSLSGPSGAAPAAQPLSSNAAGPPHDTTPQPVLAPATEVTDAPPDGGPFEAHLLAAGPGPAVGASAEAMQEPALQEGAVAAASVLPQSLSDPQPERERSKGDLARHHSSSTALELLASRPMPDASAGPAPVELDALAAPALPDEGPAELGADAAMQEGLLEGAAGLDQGDAAAAAADA